MSFIKLQKQIQNQFQELVKTGKLFRVNISGKELWDLYLNSFEEHPIWRVNSVHNCDSDRHFFERYANVVAIKDNKIISMFDFEATDEYTKSIKAVSDKIKTCKIDSIFLETFTELQTLGSVRITKNQSEYRLGKDKTLKEYRNAEEAMGKEIGKVYTFNHFNVLLPKQFVDFSGKSSGNILGDLNTTRALFAKGLNIPLDTLELVRDLIQQGSLLRGDMYLPKVLEFIKLKKQFEQLPIAERENWIWLNFQSIPYARFANELIGTTCIELAEGKEINAVCRDFNIRVDPTNYNKAKAPVTKAMIQLAEKQIEELGYSESFERRFATIDDIDISEIKHSNVDNTVEKPVGLFGKAGVNVSSSRHKRAEFEKVETVSIDKFMQDILPNASQIEVFMENKFEHNLVSLFTTEKPCKNLFKWNNPFSWTYNGNLSGKSMIRETVVSKGGNVSGIIRCSIVWNDENQNDSSDLDLWCKQPNTTEKIGFNTGFRKDSSNQFSKYGGQLDLDDRGTRNGIHAENIYFVSKEKLQKGKYEFWVNQYSAKNSKGFKAEIEVNGEVYTYNYNQPVKGNVKIADVIFENTFEVIHHLPETSASKNLWNLETNQFHKVNLVCTSPNYWGENNIGTKEYFFMIQDCKTSDAMRAFHVDQLNSELMSVRKAIDLLGNYKMVELTDKQLSGIGFNCTQRDELIVRVSGSHKRVLKIQF